MKGTSRNPEMRASKILHIKTLNQKVVGKVVLLSFTNKIKHTGMSVEIGIRHASNVKA